MQLSGPDGGAFNSTPVSTLLLLQDLVALYDRHVLPGGPSTRTLSCEIQGGSSISDCRETVIAVIAAVLDKDAAATAAGTENSGRGSKRARPLADGGVDSGMHGEAMEGPAPAAAGCALASIGDADAGALISKLLQGAMHVYEDGVGGLKAGLPIYPARGGGAVSGVP